MSAPPQTSLRIDSHPELETSSMLMAPTLEEHQAIYAKLFAREDRVLDVGAGDFSFIRKLQSLGIAAAGCNRTIPPPEDFTYDTLNFSESVGYLSREEFETYLHGAVRKVVLKDFYLLPGCPNSAEETAYNFAVCRDIVIPALICGGFRVEIVEFSPNRDRWRSLLRKYDIPYIAYPHCRTVVVWALRRRAAP